MRYRLSSSVIERCAMRMIVILACAALAIPSTALAATTYLDCSFTNSQGERQLVELALTEEKDQADVYFPRTNGRSTRQAQFSPSTVRIEMGMTAIPMAITVNRSTLKLTRSSYVGGQALREQGMCRIGKPPRRAF